MQLEVYVGLRADAGWNMVGDRDVWRAQQLFACQAVHWMSDSEILLQFY